MPQTIAELVQYIDNINTDIFKILKLEMDDIGKFLETLTNILERIDITSRLIQANDFGLDGMIITNSICEIVESVENEDYRYINAILENEIYTILNNWRNILSRLV